MRMPELKALTRECGLRNYSWLRKAELIELIQNNQRTECQSSSSKLGAQSASLAK